MKIFSDATVFDATLARLRYLFAEFPNVVVGMSGGKDSTVVFELALRVARERKRLPLTVFFLDQEAEWTATVDYVRAIMYRKEVRPLWFQMPMHLDNAASFQTKFLQCWDPAAEADWVHPKDPCSIKENRYGTDRFAELFPAIFKKEFAGQRLAVVAGVRCEESPARLMGCTNQLTYKAITWGRKLSPGQFTFYPLYDWSYRDIWTAIHREKWAYNRVYDEQYRYGVNVAEMRVSNLHHETAVRSLFHLQEMDPALYERLAKRLPGVDTAGKFGAEFYAKKLPFMFRDWPEYRDYLIEKLVDDAKWKARLVKLSAKWDALFAPAPAEREHAAKANELGDRARHVFVGQRLREVQLGRAHCRPLDPQGQPGDSKPRSRATSTMSCTDSCRSRFWSYLCSGPMWILMRCSASRSFASRSSLVISSSMPASIVHASKHVKENQPSQSSTLSSTQRSTAARMVSRSCMTYIGSRSPVLASGKALAISAQKADSASGTAAQMRCAVLTFMVSSVRSRPTGRGLADRWLGQ